MSASALRYTHVFAVPGEHSIIDSVIVGSDPPRGQYSGDTLDAVRVRYPLARLYDFDDWRRESAARQNTPITWTAITEERYSEMLDVLPPMDWDGYGFLVMEPVDHSHETGAPRFAAFRQRGQVYEESSRPITRAEFRQVKRGEQLRTEQS